MGSSARDKVAAQIRRAIIRGELAPGEHLVEQTLAERFSVSRSPVREALAVLQRLGFVEYERHRGMFVAKTDIEHVAEIYRLRAVLEGLMCAVAASRCTPDDVAALRDINEKMAEEREDVDRFLPLNVEFHRRLHAIAQSPLNARMIEELWDMSERFRRTTFLDDEATLESVRDHDLIISALEMNDAELARYLGSRAVSKRFPGLEKEEVNGDAEEAGTLAELA